MSTLTIFLCAAAFFTAQTIASSENQEKDAVIRQIDQAIEKINASATQVFRRVTELGRLEDAPILLEGILQTYKDEASQYLRSLASIVRHYILYRDTLSKDKVEECVNDFNAYTKEFSEAFVRNDNISISIWNASDYAHLVLGDLLHMAFENKIELENLKLRVNVGNTTEWNNIKENAKNISTHFLAAADKVRKFYEGLVDGTSAVKVLKFQTKWYENVSKGMDVVRKVYDCIEPKSGMRAYAVRAYNALFP